MTIPSGEPGEKHTPKSCPTCADLDRLKKATKEQLVDWIMTAETEAEWAKIKRKEAEAKVEAMKAVGEAARKHLRHSRLCRSKVGPDEGEDWSCDCSAKEFTEALSALSSPEREKGAS